jgi:hypothetical protein
MERVACWHSPHQRFTQGRGVATPGNRGRPDDRFRRPRIRDLATSRRLVCQVAEALLRSRSMNAAPLRVESTAGPMPKRRSREHAGQTPSARAVASFSSRRLTRGASTGASDASEERSRLGRLEAAEIGTWRIERARGARGHWLGPIRAERGYPGQRPRARRGLSIRCDRQSPLRPQSTPKRFEPTR